jgi:hypothetical protein
MLTMLGKINEGNFEKYHMYDSIPSYMLIFFKLIAVIAFIIGLYQLLSKNRKDGPILKFMINFSCLGFVYFLSLPVMMIFVAYMAPSSRKQVVFLSVEIMKSFVNAVMTWMICSKSSSYSCIKHETQSFFQAGRKLL